MASVVGTLRTTLILDAVRTTAPLSLDAVEGTPSSLAALHLIAYIYSEEYHFVAFQRKMEKKKCLKMKNKNLKWGV